MAIRTNTRIIFRAAILIGSIALGNSAAAVEPAANDALVALANTPVSRLDWGVDKLRRALVEHFALDPSSLEPPNPPYFVNVEYKPERAIILIELGRTLASLQDAAAKPMCAEMIGRLRGFLSVDKLGLPSIGDSSALALDYFHPIGASAPPSAAFTTALDESVRLRALVAAPINGVYAICTAGLTHSPIRHVE